MNGDSTSWRGDGPRLTRKGRRWLARRLAATLLEKLGVTSDVPELRDRFVRWYMERADRCVWWIDENTYHGDGYSCGYFHFRERTVIAEFETARREVFRQIDAERITSLDAWLEADRSGALWSTGDAGGMPRVAQVAQAAAWRRRELSEAEFPAISTRAKRESAGDAEIPRPYQVSRRSRKGTTMRCGCGAVFVGDRANAEYCNDCRAKRRKAVEARILAHSKEHGGDGPPPSP